MIATISFVKDYIENLDDPFGGYDVYAKLIFKIPIQGDKREIYFGGRILAEENRKVSGIIVFTSNISFMIEYENSKFIAHYRLDSGTEIEGWPEYESVELSEFQISVNRMSSQTLDATLKLRTREPDFIIKSPFERIIPS